MASVTSSRINISMSGQIEKNSGNAGWGFMKMGVHFFLPVVQLSATVPLLHLLPNGLSLPVTFSGGCVDSSRGYFDFRSFSCLFFPSLDTVREKTGRAFIYFAKFRVLVSLLLMASMRNEKSFSNISS